MCWTRETGVIPAALAGLLLGIRQSVKRNGPSAGGGRSNSDSRQVTWGVDLSVPPPALEKPNTG
jgi:hypothetical protein